MTVYIFSILLLLTFALLELTVTMSPYTKRAMAILVYAFLVLQVGLRWETGTDWNNYLEHFQSITTFASASPSLLSPEYGYNIAIWLVKLALPNYTAFLLIHAAVYYYLIFDSIKRYTGILFLPLMLFYCFTMGVTGSNRELLALAIGIYALRYIYNWKLTYFFLLVTLACMFHYSAVILLFFPLFKAKVRPAILLVILGCSILLGVSSLPVKAFFAVGTLIGGPELSKATFYLANSANSLKDTGLSILGLIKRFLLLSIFLYNRRFLSDKIKYYNIMLNAYVVGAVIYFIFASSLVIIVSRGSLYFDVFEPLLLASQVYLLKRPFNKIVLASALCALSFLIFFQSIAGYPDLFIPYKGLFINRDYSRMMY
jgi:hypothetical protein